MIIILLSIKFWKYHNSLLNIEANLVFSYTGIFVYYYCWQSNWTILPASLESAKCLICVKDWSKSMDCVCVCVCVCNNKQ